MFNYQQLNDNLVYNCDFLEKVLSYPLPWVEWNAQCYIYEAFYFILMYNKIMDSTITIFLLIEWPNPRPERSHWRIPCPQLQSSGTINWTFSLCIPSSIPELRMPLLIMSHSSSRLVCVYCLCFLLHTCNGKQRTGYVQLSSYGVPIKISQCLQAKKFRRVCVCA